MANTQKVGTLTIASGQTASNEFSMQSLTGVSALMFAAPGTLPETVTLQSADADAASANFGAVQSPPGTDITLAAGKRVVITDLPFPRIRLVAGVAAGADRVFEVWARVGI